MHRLTIPLSLCNHHGACRLTRYSIKILLWIVFNCGLLASSFFTTSIPGTMYGLYFFSSAQLVFIVGSILIKTPRRREVVISSLLVVTSLFCAISAWLYMYREIAQKLSPMNMFYPTFGHNHLAEWLLLVLPLSWWMAIEKKKSLLYLVPISLTLGLWLSYGRIATSLGLLELVVIAFLYETRWKHQIPRGLKIVVGLLFAGFVSVLVSGAIISTTNPSVCDNFHLQKLFCKTTELTNRTYYWQQALAIWKDNPIFGTGLGTFYNQSMKYVQTPGFQSAYAHNIVLQMLAETGVVGTIPFVLLFSYLLVRVTKNVVKAKNTLAFMVLIAVYASYINALLDFSWSYKSIFFLTLLLIAMLLSVDRQSNSQVSIKHTQSNGLVTMFTIICGVIAGIIAGSYLLVTVITSLQLTAYPNQIPNRYMKYLKQYKKEYAKLAIAKSEDEKKELFRLYGTDQDVLRELLLSTSSDSETNKYQKRMFTLDPWYALAFFDAESYLKNNTVDHAVQQVDSLVSFINQKKENFSYNPRYETQVDFANSVLIVADELFKRGEYEKSAEYYAFAQKIDPWILSKHQPVIANSEIVIDQVDFIRAIESAEPTHFGEHQAIYGTFALDLLWLNLEEGKYMEAGDLLALSVNLLPWDKWKLWDEVLRAVLDEMSGSEPEQAISFMESFLDQYRDEVVEYSEYQLREKVVQQLQKRAVVTARDNNSAATLQSIRVMQKLFGEDYWVATQLGNYYVFIGSQEDASQAFDSCLQQYDNQHDDCFNGKQAILEGRPNAERFYQVSQIILGEKRW